MTFIRSIIYNVTSQRSSLVHPTALKSRSVGKEATILLTTSRMRDVEPAGGCQYHSLAWESTRRCATFTVRRTRKLSYPIFFFATSA